MSLKNLRGTIYCSWLLHENKPHRICCKGFVGKRQVTLFSATWYQFGCVMSWRGDAQLWHWSYCVSLKWLKSMSILWMIIWAVFSIFIFFKLCWLWIKHVIVDNLDEVAGLHEHCPLVSTCFKKCCLTFASLFKLYFCFFCSDKQIDIC